MFQITAAEFAKANAEFAKANAEFAIANAEFHHHQRNNILHFSLFIIDFIDGNEYTLQPLTTENSFTIERKL